MCASIRHRAKVLDEGVVYDGELEKWYVIGGWILQLAYILQTKGRGVMNRAQGSLLASFSGH